MNHSDCLDESFFYADEQCLFIDESISFSSVRNLLRLVLTFRTRRIFMKLRFLHLGNDYWFRMLFVPFAGFLFPYVTHMIPDDNFTQTFFSKNPSLYTLPVVYFIFEINVRLLVYSKKRFFKRKNIEGYSLILVRRVILQLLLNSILMLFFLIVWYAAILQLDDFANYIYNNMFVGMSLTLAVILLFEAGYFLDKLIQEMTKTHLLEIENIKSQTKLLKNQLAPHFMFNSLSTLISLIEIDKNKAIDFLSTFSNSYRYVLSVSDDVLVDLKNELAFVDDYVSISKSNYGENSISYNVDVSKNYQKLFVPPMSVQMLVENALKHNKYTNNNPLNINIYVYKKEYLVVENNLMLKKSRFSTGMGLDSISQRYQLIGDYSINVIKSSDSFEVQIPLIKKQKTE
ncbi:MAG: histidine kinase [Flavobacteriales bacterium]|nr:histidine kinase [Flavobacteriales bacterium]